MKKKQQPKNMANLIQDNLNEAAKLLEQANRLKQMIGSAKDCSNCPAKSKCPFVCQLGNFCPVASKDILEPGGEFIDSIYSGTVSINLN